MTDQAPGAGRSRKFWLAGAVVVAIGLALAAAGLLRRSGAAHQAAAPATLIVGDQRGGAQALLRAAGELDHVPYTLKFALFPAAAPLLEALDAGAIDIGGIGGAPFAFAYASGARIRAVHAYRPDGGHGSRASAMIVRANSPLRTLADLKGRKLATIRGSAGQDLALRLIEKAGLKPSDVQWVYLANGESKAALATGAIDAWSTWGSYVGIAVLEDKDRVLADATGLSSGVGFYAAGEGAIAAKRPLLEDYIRRLVRARAWARSHPRDYAAVLARETGIPFDVALFTVTGNTGAAVTIDDKLIDEQIAIFRRYRDAGIIPAIPDVRAGYDASFNDALKEARPR